MALGEGIASSKSPRRKSEVFLAQHKVQHGCGAGTGETEAENGVRKVAGGQPRQGFAGP